jgi:hypothetical protein
VAAALERPHDARFPPEALTLEQMTRDQMIAEFGETGVQNAKIVDLIEVDPTSGEVVLVMIERRPWGADPRQFQQIEEKINRYLGYALDGHLAEHYPRYLGKPVRLRLDCAEAPSGESARFVAAAEHAASAHGVAFSVQIGLSTASRA